MNLIFLYLHDTLPVCDFTIFPLLFIIQINKFYAIKTIGIRLLVMLHPFSGAT